MISHYSTLYLNNSHGKEQQLTWPLPLHQAARSMIGSYWTRDVWLPWLQKFVATHSLGVSYKLMVSAHFDRNNCLIGPAQCTLIQFGLFINLIRFIRLLLLMVKGRIFTTNFIESIVMTPPINLNPVLEIKSQQSGKWPWQFPGTLNSRLLKTSIL